MSEVLELVGLSDQARKYPRQLSGGQRQRVGIARALANKPTLLLCDEATSALDPETTQSILRLLLNINQQLGLTIALITHDMNVIRAVANHVAILDHGRLVETGKVLDVFLNPKHETTQSLLAEIGIETESSIDATRNSTGRALRLTYQGETARLPVLSRLSRESGIDFAILQGSVGRIEGLALAWPAHNRTEHSRRRSLSAAARLSCPAGRALRGAALMESTDSSFWGALTSFDYWPEIGTATVDTLIMTGLSLLFTILDRAADRDCALVRFLHRPGASLAAAAGRAIAGGYLRRSVGARRRFLGSVPFLILLILLISVTRWIVGIARWGWAARSPPLVIGIAPFFARLVENLLREVDQGVLEACRAMGATTRQTSLWRCCRNRCLPCSAPSP